MEKGTRLFQKSFSLYPPRYTPPSPRGIFCAKITENRQSRYNGLRIFQRIVTIRVQIGRHTVLKQRC